MPVSGIAREKVPCNNLNENQMRRLIEHLLSGSTKSKLDQGALNEAAAFFSCSRKQVSGVWKRYQQAVDGFLVIDVRQKRLGTSGQRFIDVEELEKALRQVPLKNRTTQRFFAVEVSISHSTFKENTEDTWTAFCVSVPQGLPRRHRQSSEPGLGIALGTGGPRWYLYLRPHEQRHGG